MPYAAVAQAPPNPVEPTRGSPVIDVAAGAFDPASITDVLEFLPRVVTVPVGGSVHWLVHGFHNVAFASGQPYPEPIIPLPGGGVQLNPQVAYPALPGPVYNGSGYFNSGLAPEPGQPFEWTLTFAQPGTYEYACMIHPNMKAQVVVVPAGSAVPSQEEVTAQGERELAEYLAVARVQAVEQQPSQQPGPGSTTTWTVPMDIPNNPHVAVDKFFPQNLTVQVGDTVRWVNPALTEPHTVTFRAGEPRQNEFLPQPQTGAPPLLVGNPRVLEPVVPPQPYDGRTYAGSGMIGAGYPAGREWQLTFGAPGTFPYVCVLHEELGMAGFITVVP